MAGVVVGVPAHGGFRRPLVWAAEESRRRHLPLTLVHAWNEPLSITVDLDPYDLPDLDMPAHSHVEPGRAAEVLLAQPADLLVLGGHSGAPHITRATRICLHTATCPVVIVPDDDAPDGHGVVVGVDNDRASRAALTWAAEAASLRSTSLVVVHAWQLHPHGTAEILHPSRTIGAHQDEQTAAIARLVADVIGDIDVEIRTPRGAPLDALLAAAAEAELLVLGRTSHTGIRGLLHGHTSDDLSGLAPCPVAVVGPETRERALTPIR